MIIATKSYARAGFLGNPSDGYNGKTISFTMRNFVAEVQLWESPELHFQPGPVDDSRFESIDRLLEDIALYGYYGGLRLLKATTKVFISYCRSNGLALPERNFTVRYRSTIPRLVGLGGSSALCTAMFRALLKFYEVSVPEEIIPTLCLRAETDELTINAGLQDRVIQVYNGVVFMDFDAALLAAHNHGRYTRISSTAMPPVYVAYDPTRAELSGRYHRSLRTLFEQHDATIVEAMQEFAALAQAGYDCLIGGRPGELAALVNRNFDLRDRIFKVSEGNRQMVMAAREAGASAKFAGSGGAIVGTYTDDQMLDRVRSNLAKINCTVIVPEIPPATAL